MTSPIKFGTDGWRGIIADDFTFANVARCSQGLADYLRATGCASQGLVVGYDTRFASREFAETVASVVSASEIPVYLCREPAPTPVVSHHVVQLGAAGGVVITSSHNPAAWSGFKFKSAEGGSASQAVTDVLELCIDSSGEPKRLSISEGVGAGLIEEVESEPSIPRGDSGSGRPGGHQGRRTECDG